MRTRSILQRFIPCVALVGMLLMVARGAGAADDCASCPGDLNGDGEVTIDELIRGVNAALYGCSPVPTAAVTPTPTQTPNTTPGGASTLLVTGQTVCDQGNGSLGACPGAPSDQDGAVHAGVPLNYTDNGNGTVTDHATGLMWEKLSDDDGIHDWDNSYSWYDAFTIKIARLKTECFAGYCDWRLPNRRELESLVVVSHTAPAVDPVFNTACAPGCTVTTCSCTQPDSYYWTSTSYQDPSLSAAWAVGSNFGVVDGHEKFLELSVRAVRGGLP
jgi:hypothetical protein